jgi:hypothetical protein
VVAYTCHSSYKRGINRRIVVQDGLRKKKKKKQDPIRKITKAERVVGRFKW